MVCLGNICRSPMAHVVLGSKIAGSPTWPDASTSTAPAPATGTSATRWTPRAAATLRSRGLRPDQAPRAAVRRARGSTTTTSSSSWTRSNLPRRRRRSRATTTSRARVRMLRDFDPEAGGDLDVPDPWYGGQAGFDDVLAIVERQHRRTRSRALDDAARRKPTASAARGRFTADLAARSGQWCFTARRPRNVACMARMSTIASRAEQLLGTTVVSTTPVAGGDVCTATRLRLSDGRSAFVKTRPHSPADFFASEARGLRGSADAGGAPLPEVLARRRRLPDHGLGRSRPGQRRCRRDAGARSLAATHRAGLGPIRRRVQRLHRHRAAAQRAAPTRGRSSGSIRRVLPYLKIARDRASDQRRPTREAIEQVAARIERVRRAGRAAGPHPRRPLVGQHRLGRRRASPTWSTRPRTPGTARPTSRCSRCSALRTSPGCSTPTTRPARSPTAGASGSRCTRSTRCSCTRSCSEGRTEAAPAQQLDRSSTARRGRIVG